MNLAQIAVSETNSNSSKIFTSIINNMITDIPRTIISIQKPHLSAWSCRIAWILPVSSHDFAFSFFGCFIDRFIDLLRDIRETCDGGLEMKSLAMIICLVLLIGIDNAAVPQWVQPGVTATYGLNP